MAAVGIGIDIYVLNEQPGGSGFATTYSAIYASRAANVIWGAAVFLPLSNTEARIELLPQLCLRNAILPLSNRSRWCCSL